MKMSFNRWAPIEPMICEFQGLLAPTVPQFKIEQGVDCADSCPTYKKASPALKKRGVYLVFDESEWPRYIGMAAERSLIDRIRNYLKSGHFAPPWKNVIPRWIDVIPFDWKWVFLAPALELYLIDKVGEKEGNKLVNKRGTSAARSRIFD
jgi:hypothetical protein